MTSSQVAPPPANSDVTETISGERLASPSRRLKLIGLGEYYV